jgi:F-type H+-transporting ATPase subunit delta
MNESRVAFPYAKSLFQLAKEQGKINEVVADMQLIATVCAENPNLESMLKSPIIGHDKKKSIMDTIFKGRVSNLTFEIYSLLKKKNREMYLSEIAKAFVAIYKDENNIIGAKVTVASPLPEQLKSEFKQMVSSKFNSKNIELEEVINSEIIGGYILKVGDRQIDESIKGKIVALKNKFKDNPYIAKV